MRRQLHKVLDEGRSMMIFRCTKFLQGKGYLIGVHCPAPAARILSSFRHLDPRAYADAEGRAIAFGGRKRWNIMRDMCAIHGVSLVPFDHGAMRESDAYVEGEFYTSKKWRVLRMKVLVARGAKCECCGATPDDGRKMHVDHIKPRSKFPELELDAGNLQVLCDTCNLGKMAWDSTDWRRDVATV